MARLEDRVCPSCQKVCSPLLRACPACKHTFGTDPPQPPGTPQVATAPSSPIVAPAADAGADPGQSRPKIALRKPHVQHQDAAPAAPAASPPIAKIQVPVVASPGARIQAPVTPPAATPAIAKGPAPAPNAWVTVPMDPQHVARVQADSNPGAPRAAKAPMGPARAAPAAPPPIVVPPPPSASQRGAGRTLPAMALVALLAAGVAVAVLWSRKSDDPEPQPIPLPAPSTTLVPQDNPPGPRSNPPPSTPTPIPTPTSAPDPSVPRPDPSTTSSNPSPSAAPRGSTRPLGWIPASATEATETTALTADPTGDPLCRNSESPVILGQAIAITMEKEMREATRITDEEESRIGKRLELAIARDRSYAGKWDLPADVQKYGAYVSGLVKHLAKGQRRAGITYRIHLAHRSEFNAAALPGGVLLVHTGALEGSDAVHDEAELAAVLGHEIAHVEKRHTIAAYQYAKALFGDDADGQIAMKIITMPISSQYEHEADERGLELAVEGQYDPQAAVNLWRRRAATEGAAPGGILGGILDGLMRSHPRAPLRACRAMKRVLLTRDNGPWARVYDGKTNLTTHLIGPQQTY